MKLSQLSAAILISATASSAMAAPPALYTADQAKAGAQVYDTNCAMCHGADLNGGAGPALAGQSFASAGAQKTVGAVFSQTTSMMPATQPGSLTHEQYEDVMAYILQQNGYPAGPTKLSYAATLGSSVPLVAQNN
ncbi:cytochrome c [Acidocella sp.]|uniref:c-type cytochrome n=1 Tax=Acidocella sp. TaxID=50710 RepID=UPI002637FD8E|nr:cytochrome c [Acidocella sp.]